MNRRMAEALTLSLAAGVVNRGREWPTTESSRGFDGGRIHGRYLALKKRRAKNKVARATRRAQP